MGKRNPHEEEMRRLKDSNQKLRQRYRKLQKQYKKLLDITNMGYIEEEIVQVESEDIQRKRKCPTAGCDGDLIHIPAGIFKIHVCSDCDYRRRSKDG